MFLDVKINKFSTCMLRELNKKKSVCSIDCYCIFGFLLVPFLCPATINVIPI